MRRQALPRVYESSVRRTVPPGDVLFQEELSVPRVSKEGPGEVPPEAVGRACWPGALIPKCPVFLSPALGRSPQGSGAGVAPRGDVPRGARKFFRQVKGSPRGTLSPSEMEATIDPGFSCPLLHGKVPWWSEHHGW